MSRAKEKMKELKGEYVILSDEKKQEQIKIRELRSNLIKVLKWKRPIFLEKKGLLNANIWLYLCYIISLCFH